MAVGKLVTKAAAPVVEEVVSQFTKRLFRGAKIPSKTQKIVGGLNKIDQKTILSSIRKEPEIAEGWKNMFINAGSDDMEVKLSAFEELNQSLTRFRGEAKLEQKENRIDDMFYTDAKSVQPTDTIENTLFSGQDAKPITSDQLTELGNRIKSKQIEAPKTLTNRNEELATLKRRGLLEREPQNRFEALFFGADEFVNEKDIPTIIRRFRSQRYDLGRTDIAANRRRDRGGGIRLDRENRLTLGEDQGFYAGTPKGSHAHHWTPLAVLDKVVEGLSPKQVKIFLTYMEKKLGIFSGNHIGNLRQLPDNIHNMLHRRLEDLGYNPQTLKSFLGASLQERKAFLKKMKLDFDRLEEEIFREMMIRKGNQAGPQLK
jgi:hypothetical protein